MACSKDQLLTNQLDLEEDLTCPICLELYNDPVSLPCQHNFCRKCIHSHLHQKSDIDVHVIGTKHRFPCPNCRDYVELTDADIEKLPKNFALQNIIHKYQSLKMENETQDTEIMETNCMQHNKPLMVYCDTCDEALCIECFPKRSHENHSVVHVKEKLKIYQKDVEQTLLPEVIKLQESLKEMKNTLTGNHQETKELLQVYTKDVTERFQELRSAVNQKESELTFFFESKKEEIDSRYKTHTDSLDEQLHALENLNTKFSTISFQDPAKTIQEIRSDKERCEEASRNKTMTSERIKPLLGDVKELDVSKQIHELNDDLKRIMSDINNMGRGKVGHTEGAAEPTIDFDIPTVENSSAASSTEPDEDIHGRRKVKIVDPNTGKDISSEIYKGRQRLPLHYREEGITRLLVEDLPQPLDNLFPYQENGHTVKAMQSDSPSLLPERERRRSLRKTKNQKQQERKERKPFSSWYTGSDW